jgi:hypothetical protein
MTIDETERSRSREVAADFGRVLGTTRAGRLRHLVKMTGLPPEAVLDLALELVDVASRKLTVPPLTRTAVQLGAARWRDVSVEDRSKLLRRAAQARWAKVKKARRRSSGSK